MRKNQQNVLVPGTVFALKTRASGAIQEYMVVRVGRLIKNDGTYSYMTWMSSRLTVAPAPGQNAEWSLLFLVEASWLLGAEACAALIFRKAIPVEVKAGEALFAAYKTDHGNDKLARPHTSKKRLFSKDVCVSVDPEDNIDSTYEEDSAIDVYLPGQADGGKDGMSGLAPPWQVASPSYSSSSPSLYSANHVTASFPKAHLEAAALRAAWVTQNQAKIQSEEERKRVRKEQAATLKKHEDLQATMVNMVSAAHNQTIKALTGVVITMSGHLNTSMALSAGSSSSAGPSSSSSSSSSRSSSSRSYSSSSSSSSSSHSDHPHLAHPRLHPHLYHSHLLRLAHPRHHPPTAPGQSLAKPPTNKSWCRLTPAGKC